MRTIAVDSAIAKAAGRDLTEATFAKAGYGLRNIILPDSGGAVSFGEHQSGAFGPGCVGKYNSAVGTVTYATKSAGKYVMGVPKHAPES